MAVLDIVTYPDPRLREPTFDVKEVDANIRQLVRDLIDTMYSLNAAGIGYDRMTTTDSGLRIEYFKNGVYARIYAVPSAHTQLDKTPLGGYPYLGYLVRCGAHTIYHAGDCVPYEGLAESLRPYNVTVALLPIEGPQAGTFTAEEASQLAEEIGARWLVPMHYGAFSQDDPSQRFLDHIQSRQNVWICRRIDIARHWKRVHPFDAVTAHTWS